MNFKLKKFKSKQNFKSEQVLKLEQNFEIWHILKILNFFFENLNIFLISNFWILKIWTEKKKKQKSK
jgi:hypothetical protein